VPAASGGLLFLMLLSAAVFGAAVALTRVLIPLLARAVLDRPNRRSSHTVPTPRGGGIAILAAVLPGWAVVLWLGLAPAGAGAAIVGALIVAIVSFADDLRGLPAAARLAAQLGVVAFALAWLPGAGAIFQGLLPPWLDLLLTGLLWVWLVNLYNFMDGIDGIAAVETVCIGLGLVLVAAASGLGSAPLAAALAAGAAGFLVWNRHPARIFMGDVGSVPVGFLVGWLLLEAAGKGLWAPALLLPLYFLADATWTLLRRIAHGHRPWQPHREHFYQLAVRRGLGHGAVVRRVLVADLVLILCAMAALRWPVAALLGGVAVTAALLVALRGSVDPRRIC
jgi:UDP-N-acetylmuramyl pentapeptide phosphotransferase/UDP-N-acetylglucosamine-1-phosphate transferase